MSRPLVALLAAFLLAAPATAADPSPFARFVDDYYAALFDWDPNQATYAGVHERDDKLADRSAPAVARRVDQLKKLAARLAAVRPGKLTADEAIDADVLDRAIRAELLDLEVVHDWKVNPMGYVGKPAEAIDLITKRAYAP